MSPTAAVITAERFDAVLFDLDGVLTDTARVHAECWKRAFDDFLRERAEKSGKSFDPFDKERDYLAYVDGKPRYEGVASFLASRDIELPWGSPEDPPERETVCGLGNRKNRLLQAYLERERIEPYPGSVALVHDLHRQGIRTAVVSSSKNCAAVLAAAGIEQLFEERVDGIVAAELGLKGKPYPDTFLEAAGRLKVAPARAVVVEDALSGVEAGRRGRFGLVVGVGRGESDEELLARGADLVVADLAELLAGKEAP